MQNYYIFICMDSMPILELLLDKKYEVITNYQEINWQKIKYIILNFKTLCPKKESIIKKGKIIHQTKVLIKNLTYYQINIKKAIETIEKKKIDTIPKKYTELILFTHKMFYCNPKEFIKYTESKHLFSKKEIEMLKKANTTLKKENELLRSWKNITKKNEKDIKK